MLFDDAKTIMTILTLVNSGGIGIIVFIVWYIDLRKERKREGQHEERIQEWKKQWEARERHHGQDLQAFRDAQNDILRAMERERADIVAEFKSAMGETRQMYLNNASLVKRYEALVADFKALTSDLKDAYILNTQTMEAIANAVRTHQYCPQVRQSTGTFDKKERPLDD